MGAVVFCVSEFKNLMSHVQFHGKITEQGALKQMIQSGQQDDFKPV